MEDRIYFDNGSTSWPKAPGVAEAVSELLTNGAFNINRGNYTGAYEVAGVVLDTRDKLAEMFQVQDSRRVIFTPGVTCSLTIYQRLFKGGRSRAGDGIGAQCVMRPLYQMTRKGVTYDVIPVDEQGNLDPAHAESLIRPETKAMIVSHASNVCGTVVPIEDLGEICERHQLFFVVDTAQTARNTSCRYAENED